MEHVVGGESIYSKKDLFVGLSHILISAKF